MRRYTVVLEWDEEAGAYSVVVPMLPGCASLGKTVEEALDNVREAIDLYRATLEERGEPVPEERAGAVVVTSVAA